MIINKLKVVSALALTGVLTLSFTSCSTSSAISPTSAAKKSKTEKIEKNINNILSVNAVAEKPSKTKYDVFNASLKPINEKQLEEMFFKGEKSLERHASGKDLSSIGSTDKYIISKNASLHYDKDYISYTDKLSDEFSLLISDGKRFFHKDIGKFFPKSELSSYSKKDAIEKVKDISSSLGLNLSKTPTVYALDSESLTKREKEVYPDKDYEDFINYVKKNGGNVESKSRKRNYTTEDESYLVIFELELDNTAIFSDHYPTPDNSSAVVNPSRVNAIVSKSGVHFFEALGNYNTTLKSENQEIIDVNKALETAILAYEKTDLYNLSTKNDTSLVSKISDISLKYAPNKEDKNNLTLTPSWTFKVDQTITFKDGKAGKTFTHSTPTYIVIDAVTGKEIK